MKSLGFVMVAGGLVLLVWTFKAPSYITLPKDTTGMKANPTALDMPKTLSPGTAVMPPGVSTPLPGA